MSDSLSLYLSGLMALAYVGGGIGLIASSQSFGFLPTGTFRIILAALLIVYGCFRGFRAYQRYQEGD